MLRKLSEAEGMFLRAIEEMPLGFLVAARIRGGFSLEQLKEALTKAQRRHPILAVRLKRDEEGQAWMTSEGVPEMPVRVVEGVGDEDWVAEARRTLVEPFPIDTGPLARFLWLRSMEDPERSDLMAVVHHGIADGHSGASLLRDVLHYLGHPDAAVEPLPLQPLLEDLIPAEVAQRLTEKIRAQLHADSLVSLDELRQDDSFTGRWALAPAGYHLRAWSLTRAQTDSLVARSREEQTTVHGALGAAFLSAFAHVLGREKGEWKRTVQSPVSLRDRLSVPIGEDVGVFMSHITTTVDCSSGREFWDIAREVRASTRDQLESEEIFARAVMSRVIAEMVSTEQALPRRMVEHPESMFSWDLSLSNLGRLDFPTTYGPLQLEALHGPVFAAAPGDRIVGVMTFDGRMSLMFICREATMELSVVDQIIAESIERLAGAMGWETIWITDDV